MSERAKGAAIVGESTRCGRCGRGVGLLWYKGHSTLVDGPLVTDGLGRLVLTRHVCFERPPGRAAGRPARDPR